uniref:deaminase n=1 Tax=Clostridium sp. NkU-1 TaxID=1095009 RepID=UPI000AE1BD4E
MDYEIDVKNLKRCAEISRQSREGGNTPFGALLAGKDGSILLEQPNVEITEGKCTGHAETQVAERASQLYSKNFLGECTLYTTAEPCACVQERSTGQASDGWCTVCLKKICLPIQGQILRIPPLICLAVRYLQGDRKKIEVVGPFPELVEEIAEVHKGYWNN